MSDLLVLRALGLGDLLASVPALRGLRRAFPHSRLLLAAPGPIGHWLVSQGVVDDVVVVTDLADAARLPALVPTPSVAVNLHGRGPRSHEVLARSGARRLFAFSCPTVGHHEGPRWCADEHEVDRWVRLVRCAGGPCGPEDLVLPPVGEPSDHVVIHPGAAAPARRWPVARWRHVAQVLAAQGRRVVVTGSAGERAWCAQVADGVEGVVDGSGRTGLAELARVVGSAAAVLSGDTGVAHLATALRRPSVVLFGPVSPALWGPRVDLALHRVLWAGDPEADGLRPGDPHGVLLDPLLDRIAVDDVLEAAQSVLAERERHAVCDPSPVVTVDGRP
ncbi:MAG TPA: glycosyltransferase family 9 protein [Ornithinibacter sp.]|nr:glycosyltransferase family 9 protein [Ornithinibacter sp.]